VTDEQRNVQTVGVSDGRGTVVPAEIDADEIAQQAGEPGFNATFEDGTTRFVRGADLAELPADEPDEEPDAEPVTEPSEPEDV
jgi:hypothetical protein